jgi:hypothetical protein
MLHDRRPRRSLAPAARERGYVVAHPPGRGLSRADLPHRAHTRRRGTRGRRRARAFRESLLLVRDRIVALNRDSRRRARASSSRLRRSTRRSWSTTSWRTFRPNAVSNAACWRSSHPASVRAAPRRASAAWLRWQARPAHAPYLGRNRPLASEGDLRQARRIARSVIDASSPGRAAPSLNHPSNAPSCVAPRRSRARMPPTGVLGSRTRNRRRRAFMADVNTTTAAQSMVLTKNLPGASHGGGAKFSGTQRPRLTALAQVNHRGSSVL